MSGRVDPEYNDVERTINRLTAMFTAVSDPDTKQDCATVALTTTPGEANIEYGAFHDGDVLNVPTAKAGHTVTSVVERVEREPEYSGEGYVVFGVDDLNEPETAELVLDATGGWSGIEIVRADLRTIETGTVVDQLVRLTGKVFGRSS